MSPGQGSGASTSPGLVFPVGRPGLGNYRSGAVPRLGELWAGWRPSFGVPQWGPPGPALTPLGTPRESLSQPGGPRQHQGGCDGAGEGLGGGRGLGVLTGVNSLCRDLLQVSHPGRAGSALCRALANLRTSQASPSLPGYPSLPACTKGVPALLWPHFPQIPAVPGTPRAGIWPHQGSGLACPPRPRSGALAALGRHVLSQGAFPPGIPVLPSKAALPSPAGSAELIAQGAVTVFYCNYFSCWNALLGGRGGSCALRCGLVPGPEVLSFHLSQRAGPREDCPPPETPRAVPASLLTQIWWIFLLGLRGTRGGGPGDPHGGVWGRFWGTEGLYQGRGTPQGGVGILEHLREQPALRGAAKTLVPWMHSPLSPSTAAAHPRPCRGAGGHREQAVLGVPAMPTPPGWEGR